MKSGRNFTRMTFLAEHRDCLVNYNSGGYFIATKNGDSIEQSTTLSIRCPNDGTPMYLAEVHAEHKSYQRWKCPQRDKSIANLESIKPGHESLRHWKK